MKRIFVYASELAGLTGKNRYQPQDEAIEKFMCRLKKIPNKEQMLEGSLNSEQREIITRNLGKVENTSQVKSTIQEIQQEIITNPKFENHTQKEEISKMVERMHQTEFGTKKEERVKSTVEVSHNVNIMKDDVFHSRFLFETKEYKVYLGGKCDGVTTWNGQKTIVEIKNRINRLFHKIPEYEKVQMYAYMYIFDLQNAILVENYNQESNIIECKFDHQEWQDIVKTLESTFYSEK